ncbi:MAG TPA: glutathione binding-like protein [Bradyrhizobium sp.]|uniref:glutathione S-transferase family protein n=1 Tax=Bradyrhizobium sp. TaxID=376 RepID=UPI002B7F6061|nr:glutathione binding-like protein [Bradyrhizobium sp.]HTA99471.1 glutathione binding-like protein [Bradyrhizobium sp.]
MQASFAIAEKHLVDRAFVLGNKPTIADFSLAGYVYYPPEETGFDTTADFPAIDAWRQRLAALPGWKLPYELIGVGSTPPVRVVRTAYIGMRLG